MSRRDFITQAEAAKSLGCTPRTIRNLISRGMLVGYQIAGLRAVRIDRTELEALVRRIPTVAPRNRVPFGGNVVRVAAQAVYADPADAARVAEHLAAEAQR